MKNLYSVLTRGFSFIIGSIMIFASTAGSAEMILYAIRNTEPSLHAVNPITGAEISSVAISLPGETINNSTGLAVSPTTNEMYAAVKLDSQSGPGRNLIKINPETGQATNIGNIGQPIASLAFRSDGVLFGVSGDCANNCGGMAISETLFTINTANANPTFFQTLGNGDDGEAIAYNPVDGMMYHMLGVGAGLIFEKIDLGNGVVTPIPLSGDSVDELEAIGFTFDPAQNLFVGSLIDCFCDSGTVRTFITLTPGGFLSHVSTLDYWWKDYAFYSKSNLSSPAGVAVRYLLLSQ